MRDGSDGSGDASATAILFERDSAEELTDWEAGLPRLGRSSILWIDLERPDERDIDRLAAQLELTEESARHLLDGDGAHLVDCGTYLQVTAHAPSSPEERTLQRIVCVVSERWIVTVREAPLEALDIFRERATGSGATGELDGPTFLATLLEWVLQSYLEAFEEIELSLEEIDAAAMRGNVKSEEAVLGRLVGYRREIGQLRRALTSHRETVLALGRPEIEAIGGSDSAERFTELRQRLEEAIQAARESREAVVGSFDVLIASTGQRTNDIMKVLTLASVLLLPGALIAGVLGMNFKLGFFAYDVLFWVVLAAIVMMMGAVLVAARLRDWI